MRLNPDTRVSHILLRPSPIMLLKSDSKFETLSSLRETEDLWLDDEDEVFSCVLWTSVVCADLSSLDSWNPLLLGGKPKPSVTLILLLPGLVTCPELRFIRLRKPFGDGSRSRWFMLVGFRVTALNPRVREQPPWKHFSPLDPQELPSNAGWAGVAHDPEIHQSSRQTSW